MDEQELLNAAARVCQPRRRLRNLLMLADWYEERGDPRGEAVRRIVDEALLPQWCRMPRCEEMLRALSKEQLFQVIFAAADRGVAAAPFPRTRVRVNRQSQAIAARTSLFSVQRACKAAVADPSYSYLIMCVRDFLQDWRVAVSRRVFGKDDQRADSLWRAMRDTVNICECCSDPTYNRARAASMCLEQFTETHRFYRTEALRQVIDYAQCVAGGLS